MQLSAHAIARLIEFGFSFINFGTVAGERGVQFGTVSSFSGRNYLNFK